MSAPITPELKGKIEELLGERRPVGGGGKPPAAAVRWRDLEAVRKTLVDAGGADGIGGGGGGGTPGSGTFPDDWQEIIDQIQREIDAAERDAQAALEAAQNLDSALQAVQNAAAEALQTTRTEIDAQRTADMDSINGAIAAIDGQIDADMAALQQAVTGDISTLRDEVAGEIQSLWNSDAGISSRLDLVELAVSNTSYIRTTDGEGGIGQWTGLTGAAAPVTSTSNPPGQTGASIQIGAPGAYELPYYGGVSIKDAVFRIRGWVWTSAGATARAALVGSTQGTGPGGQTVLVQSDPIATNGGWQQIDLRMTVPVDTDEWAPAFLVSAGGTMRFKRVKLEDFSAASALEASISENAIAIIEETAARIGALQELKASLTSPLRKLMPSEITGDFWRHANSGLPGSSGLHPSVTLSTDGVATIPASATTNVHFVTQETLPWEPGRTYRVTPIARSNGQPTNGRLRLVVFALRDDYSGIRTATTAPFNIPVADQWQILPGLEWTVPAPTGAETQFRIGVYVQESVTPDVAIDLRSVRIDDVTAGKQAVADITAVLTNSYYTRVDTDGAIAAKLSEMEAEYFTPTKQVRATALTEYYTRTDANAATAAAIEGLETEYFTPDGQVRAAALTQYYTRTSADTAIAAALDALEAKFFTPTGQVRATALTNYYTRADANSAISAAVNAFKAEFFTPDGQVRATALTNYYTKTSADQAIAAAGTTLRSAMEAPTGSIGQINSNLTNNYYTRTTADQAIAAAVNALDAKYFTPTGQVRAGALDQYYTKTAADSAVSAAIQTHRAEFFTPTGQVRATALTDYYTKTAADQAIAASRETLSASLDQAFSRGGVLSDQFLALMSSAAWRRWSAGGSLTRTANELYPSGMTWDFNITATTQQDGMLTSSDTALWVGQTDAAGYVVEIEYTMVSGQVGGAGVQFSWSNSVGANYWAHKSLAEMQAGLGVPGQPRLARAVIKKPANFTGTFSHHTVYFFANYDQPFTGTNQTKRIKVHRINIRVASEEEMGRGEVMGEVTATLERDYFTRAQTNSAISGSIDSYDASIAGGVKANVTSSRAALANLNGSVATASLLTNVDGGRAIAGFEIASWNTTGQGTGAAVKLHGDVLAPGTMSVGALLVGVGSNMLQNSRFTDGVTHWRGVTGAQTSFSVREKGTSYAHPSFRTLELRQSGTGADTSYIRYNPQSDADNILTRAPGAPCKPGAIYCASGYLSLHRCRGRVVLTWFRADGTGISPSVPGAWQPANSGSSSNPDTWPRYHVSGKAPADAAYVGCYFQKEGTQAGASDSYLFLWKPQIEETHSLNAEPALYTSGEAGYFTGDTLFTNFLQARHVSTDTMRALNGQFANLAAANIRIGRAEITSAHIDDLTIGPEKIKVNGLTTLRSVSVPSTSAPSSGERVAGTLSFTPYEEGTKLLISLEGTATSAMGTGTTPASYRCDVKLYLNGTRIGAASVGPAGGVGSGFTAASDSIDMNRVRVSAAGTNTIQVRVSNAGQINASAIRVQEFNR